MIILPQTTPLTVFGDPIRTVPPQALPVSLAEVRAHVRLTDDDGTEEDALLMGYLRSAVEYAEAYTGLALITQTIEQRFSAFGAEMVLRRRPVQAVLEIEYQDAEDGAQTLSASVYRVAGMLSDKVAAVVRLGHSQSWPTVYGDAEAIRITYRAGFGDSHNEVPERIRQAIMMLAGYWMNQRESALIDPIIVEVPFGIHALLREWRPLAIA